MISPSGTSSPSRRCSRRCSPRSSRRSSRWARSATLLPRPRPRPPGWPAREDDAMTAAATASLEQWPSLALDAWQDTYATLHMWLQVVGKIRLQQSPWVNHSWHVTLYVTARGLTTSPIPDGARTFQIDLDFVHHRLVVLSSDGREGGFALEPQSVATFYARLM